MSLKYSNLLFYKKFLSKKNNITHKKNIFIDTKLTSLCPKFLGNNKWVYYSLTLFLSTNVRAFRLLFGYPSKGQRTWSNASTNKNCNNVIYNLKFNKFSKEV